MIWQIFEHNKEKQKYTYKLMYTYKLLSQSLLLLLVVVAVVVVSYMEAKAVCLIHKM